MVRRGARPPRTALDVRPDPGPDRPRPGVRRSGCAAMGARGTARVPAARQPRHRALPGHRRRHGGGVPGERAAGPPRRRRAPRRRPPPPRGRCLQRRRPRLRGARGRRAPPAALRVLPAAARGAAGAVRGRGARPARASGRALRAPALRPGAPIDCRAMTLRELLGDGPDDVEITGLAFDNRKVEPGTLFFCVPGFTRDGHDYAPDAVARGAAALVVCRPLGLGVPEVLVDDVRAAMAPIAARFHGDPTARLGVVGITGTNGKTTTAFLVREVLHAAGRRTALLGTVKSVIGGVEAPLARTTPEAVDLQAAFADMLRAGDAACAMEVSSHALALHRADAIHWAVALFTNLT